MSNANFNKTFFLTKNTIKIMKQNLILTLLITCIFNIQAQLISNGNLEAGTGTGDGDSFTGWYMANNGDGNMTIETTEVYSGSRGLKVVTVNLEEHYHSQMFSPVFSSTSGKTYSISFWIKSSVAGAVVRTVLQLDGVQSEYGADFVTTTGWTQYTRKLTIPVGDPNTQIIFDFGKETVASRIHYADHFYVEEDISTTTEMISNGDLEAGTGTGDGDSFTGWYMANNGDGNMTIETTEFHGGARALKVVTVNPEEHYHSQMFSPVFSSTSGKTYNISFWIKSSVAGAVVRTVLQLDGVQSEYGADVATTTDWTQYTRTLTIPTGNASTQIIFDFGKESVASRIHYVDDFSVQELTSFEKNIFIPNSGTSANWSSITDWNYGIVPTTSNNVEITTGNTVNVDVEGVTNDLTVNGNLNIAAGKAITANGNFNSASGTTTVASDNTTGSGSLIIKGTSTGNITYNRYVEADKWHLVGAPVTGEGYDDTYVTANNITGGTINPLNRGVSTYNNATNTWSYMVSGGSGSFINGAGFSMLTSGTSLAFTGEYFSSDKNVTLSDGAAANAWNLVSNPYPSFISVDALIAANTTDVFDAGGLFNVAYVWDNTENAGAGGYVIKNGSSGYYLHPGQGFVVNGKAGGGVDLKITEAMQSHQTGIGFLKTEANPEIKVMLSNSTSVKSTKIEYREGATNAVDTGYDAGYFSGADDDFKIYSHLVEGTQETDIMLQSLAQGNYEKNRIPLGLKADIGEFTLSVNHLNLPENLMVFIEDSLTGKFTRLDEANSALKINLDTKIDGVGRFFLHTSYANMSLSIEDTIFNNLNVFANNNILHINGSNSKGKAFLKVFNILGKLILNQSLKLENNTSVILPKVSKGVYVVSIKSENGNMLNKKIIIE